MHLSTATLISLGLIFGLLVVPRALQRFRIPAQLTCVALGILVTTYFPQMMGDSVIPVLSTLGISSLFLFAGLEVDLVVLRKQLPRLSVYLLVGIVFLVIAAWVAMRYLHLGWQSAALLALGLFTPSTGFILDTLPNSGLDEFESRQVTISAIAGEIAALAVLFVVSQASSASTLITSSGILILLVVLTPMLFLALGKYVVPYAPGSEFSLLLMVAVICAVISKGLGVYYLLGAFVAGLVASLLQDRMATLASAANLEAVRLFSSFFVPFYFFHAGMEVPAGALVGKALFYGLALSVIVLPIRLGKDLLAARLLAGRSGRSAARAATALMPTLVFTLVIAGMLRDAFHITDELFGGLLVYAAISTILPSFALPKLTTATLDLPDVEVLR